MRQKGFTFIEMIIAVMIIAILAAFAYPQYQQYIINGNRVDVQSEMVQIAQRIENYKLARSTYNDVDLSQAGIFGGSAFPKQGKSLYTLALTLNAQDGIVTGWVLEATPKTDGIQKDNGIVRLNNLGHKCWQKAAASCTLSANSNWDGK